MSKFNPVKIAQEILDQDLSIKIKEGQLIIGNQIYSRTESNAIVNEFNDMMRIAMRCKMVSSPTRNKLETLGLSCNSL